MNNQLLIHLLVRQAMVLVAGLSTAEGSRSPLGHIANELFTGLAKELEKMGVRHAVAADMFGMALRSYRQKVQKLRESESTRGETLWTAVHTFVQDNPHATRPQVVAHFSGDHETSVRAILKDLTDNGWLVSTGKGADTSYRTPTDEELQELGASFDEESRESLAALIWLQIYREGEMTRQSVEEFVSASKDRVADALSLLVAEGRVEASAPNGEEVFVATKLLIPVGEEAGWEAAVVDHHRAVCNAIAAKATSRNEVSGEADLNAGTTLTFKIWPGHPKEREVRRLLAETRATVLPFWDEFVKDKHPPRDGAYKVHFYFGQYLSESEHL